MNEMDNIDYNEFAKMELVVGEIVSAENHPDATKLLVLKVNVGEAEDRTIVAGLREYYSPEALVGKKAIFVANLKPAMLRGVESKGMILAAVTKDRKDVKILSVDGDIPAGTRIS